MAMLEEAEKFPQIYDNDCPKLTPEQLSQFKPVHYATMEERVRAIKKHEPTLVTGEEIIVPGLSPEALEIARATEKLSAEGKKAAMGAVEGLQRVYPCGISESTGTAG
jgi:NTP pyrophosphatase (non-canonical NTP hydrolase)